MEWKYDPPQSTNPNRIYWQHGVRIGYTDSRTEGIASYKDLFPGGFEYEYVPKPVYVWSDPDHNAMMLLINSHLKYHPYNVMRNAFDTDTKYAIQLVDTMYVTHDRFFNAAYRKPEVWRQIREEYVEKLVAYLADKPKSQ